MWGCAHLTAALLGALVLATGFQVAAGTVSAVRFPTLSGGDVCYVT